MTGGHRTERLVRLVVSCAVLGAGVTLLLRAALGSDGYSSLVHGVTRSTGLPFFLVNTAVGVLLVGLAWLRGRAPGLGTLVQPLVVGGTISVGLAVLAEPAALGARAAYAAASFVLLTIGVAGYLATDTGAGPAEAAALAWDPPVPFRWSYSAVQGGGALTGWLLGAAIGPGTLLVVVALGPAVDAALGRWPVLHPGRRLPTHPDTRPAPPAT